MEHLELLRGELSLMCFPFANVYFLNFGRCATNELRLNFYGQFSLVPVVVGHYLGSSSDEKRNSEEYGDPYLSSCKYYYAAHEETDFYA